MRNSAEVHFSIHWSRRCTNILKKFKTKRLSPGPAYALKQESLLPPQMHDKWEKQGLKLPAMFTFNNIVPHCWSLSKFWKVPLSLRLMLFTYGPCHAATILVKYSGDISQEISVCSFQRLILVITLGNSLIVFKLWRHFSPPVPHDEHTKPFVWKIAQNWRMSVTAGWSVNQSNLYCMPL